MSRIKVEKHAMLEQRQQVLAYRAAEVQQQVSTSDDPLDLVAASSEYLAFFDWLERKIRVKEQDRAIAVEIIESQAVKKIAN